LSSRCWAPGWRRQTVICDRFSIDAGTGLWAPGHLLDELRQVIRFATGG
jgi:hypothetical protein